MCVFLLENNEQSLKNRSLGGLLGFLKIGFSFLDPHWLDSLLLLVLLLLAGLHFIMVVAVIAIVIVRTVVLMLIGIIMIIVMVILILRIFHAYQGPSFHHRNPHHCHYMFLSLSSSHVHFFWEI